MTESKLINDESSAGMNADVVVAGYGPAGACAAIAAHDAVLEAYADEPSLNEQRVAVVTGGSGAIGGAIMAALASSGHDPVSLDRVGDPPVDLGNESMVRAAAGSVLARHGRCDVLVHAAAAFDRADLASVDLTAWRRPRSIRSGRGRRSPAHWCRRMSRPPRPSWRRTRRRR